MPACVCTPVFNHDRHIQDPNNINMVSKGDGANFHIQKVEGNPASPPMGIAVAVGKGDSSVQALKWTLETLVTSDSGKLHILHVQDPLRFVQTPLGYLPMDQANEESRKQARKQQTVATEKVLQKYRKMCEKKKVNFEVHCVENISIHKAVVEQILNLGISKLVLGSSSQSKLKKFLKGPQTSAVLAQNVPAFCAVMVVRKGRLSSVKDADNLSQSSQSSPFPSSSFDTSVCGTNQDVWSERGPYSASTNTSVVSWTPPPSDQFSLTCKSGHEEQLGSGDLKMIDMISEHFPVKTSRSPPPLPSPSSSGHPLEPTQSTHRHSRPNSVEEQWWTSQAMETKHKGETPETLMSRSRESVMSSIEACTMSNRACLAPPCEPLAMPKVLEAIPSDKVIISNMVGKSVTENLEASHSHLMGEITKKVETCASFQDALILSEKKATQVVAEGVKRWEQMAAGVKRWEEVVVALSTAKMEAESSKREMAMAKQQVEAERSKHLEAVAEVEELKQELARETALRKMAEERARRAKRELARLLSKAHRAYQEFSFEELKEATNDFHEKGKLGEGGYGGVYMGTIDQMAVAVKVLRQASTDGQQQFQHEVEVLSHIQHPNIVVLLGACQERACIVYEYMENGSLEDRLACKNGTPPLSWYTRFSICFEVATALIFLHNLSPNPIVHRDLKPGNILLDCNFVSKLSDAGLARWIPNNLTYDLTVYRETSPAGTFAYMDPEYLRTGSFGPHSDIFALGIIILQMLTGKPPVGVVDLVEAAVDENRLVDVLDQTAGDWPLVEAVHLAKLGLRCTEPRRRDRPHLETDIFTFLKRLNEMAQNVAAKDLNGGADGIPSLFVCPLSLAVMDNPHTAADGFTYEYAAIKNWLRQHDTSPMTNLKIAHKQLSRNEALQARIQSWKEETRRLEATG